MWSRVRRRRRRRRGATDIRRVPTDIRRVPMGQIRSWRCVLCRREQFDAEGSSLMQKGGLIQKGGLR
jgi:hypothetical protein